MSVSHTTRFLSITLSVDILFSSKVVLNPSAFNKLSDRGGEPCNGGARITVCAGAIGEGVCHDRRWIMCPLGCV